MSIRLPRICWPFTIDSTNKSIRMTYNLSHYLVTITEGDYYTPEALIYAVAKALQTAAQEGGTFSGRTVTGSLEGGQFVKFAIGGTGWSSGTWSLDWAFSGCAALGVLLGFSAASTPANQSASSVLGSRFWTADQQIKGLWLPGKPVARDSLPQTAFTRGTTESTGGVVVADLARRIRRTISFGILPISKVFIASEATVNESLERLWRDGSARFLWFDDASSMGLSSASAPNDRMADKGNGSFYALNEDVAQAFAPKRPWLGVDLFDVELGMIGAEE